MPTMAEEVLAAKAGREVVPGEFISVEPDWCLLHDGGFLAFRYLEEMSAGVARPGRVVVAFDHICPANSPETAGLQDYVREMVGRYGIENFFDCGCGICHQVMAEEFARPGDVIIGGDSHTLTAGALGAFAAGMGASDMAVLLATGEVWLKVPESIKVTVEGEPGAGVFPKDLALSIIAQLGPDGANYRAVEFHGSTVMDMDIPGRMTLCNMAAEMGAKTAMVPPDGRTAAFTGQRGVELTRRSPDRDAEYLEEMAFEPPSSPMVAVPHRVDDARSVEEVEGTEVDQVFIGSCTNGRLEDLEAAEGVIRGREVRARTLVAPASRRVLLEAAEAGLIASLARAGCVILPPGCGPCLGQHQGVLGEGETAFSTSSRNFRGRQGSPEAGIYLGSPATAAATAVEGRIADPRRYL
ncbi:MAG: 3-isopropylmalate dehydratase/homoaconitate hydratase family large subunit [Acidobacteria bacterium]|nr:3-isopropylmalate dehydratase/homoaconitate hydratase family large subunit [Acidobacteriota bacterium]